MLGINILSLLSLITIVFSLKYYFSNNDEIPLSLAIFNFIAGVSRYRLVESGTSSFVSVNYTLDIFNLTFSSALKSSSFILLGTICFILSYVYNKNMLLKHRLTKQIDSQYMLDKFIRLHSRKIVLGFVVFYMLNSLVSINSYTNIALGTGYIFLLGFGYGGFILLILLLIGSKEISLFFRMLLIILLVVTIPLTFQPYLRFAFLSWAVAATFLFIKNAVASRKFLFFSISLATLIIAFSYFGMLRSEDRSNATITSSINRVLKFEDVNFLDGFMMVLDVYPEHLDYHLGGEHLEILLRPIPRKIWANKPLGGYANKLGLNDLESAVTVGISPTLYGSFYGEGGIIGIIVLSVIYGRCLAWLFFLVRRYNSDLKYLIKGVIFSSLIPLLRGGDLPGVYAFIGMSFWPIFIFMWRYSKFLRKVAVPITD